MLASGVAVAVAAEPGFEVTIEQGGRARTVGASVAHVDRGPFVVVVRSPPKVLLVNASTDPTTWRAAAAGQPLSAMPGFAQTGIAEDSGNREQAIYVDHDAPMAWTAERFDGCVVEPSGTQVCRRTVSRVAGGPELAAFPEADLYLVFAQTRWTQQLGRELVRAYPVRLHLEGTKPE